MAKKLFDIQQGKIVLDATTLWIPEFKKLWDRDKSVGKGAANKELSYVVFKHGFHSPYMAYSERSREQKILEDYFKDNKSWKPDADVKAAETKYIEMQDSPALRLLRTTNKALEVIEMYYQNAYDNAIRDGIVSDTVLDKVVKNAKELGTLIQSLGKLKTQVEKELKEGASVRGEGELGDFEL